MRCKMLLLLIAVAFVCAATAYAHHSFTATYQQDKTFTIEGKVVQFLIRNPHSFIHVQAPDEKGQMQTWSIEGGTATQMRNSSGEALKLGDHVVVVANPARSPSAHRGRLISITRPSDGWSWGGRAGQVVD